MLSSCATLVISLYLTCQWKLKSLLLFCIKLFFYCRKLQNIFFLRATYVYLKSLQYENPDFTKLNHADGVQMHLERTSEISLKCDLHSNASIFKLYTILFYMIKVIKMVNLFENYVWCLKMLLLLIYKNICYANLNIVEKSQTNHKRDIIANLLQIN